MKWTTTPPAGRGRIVVAASGGIACPAMTAARAAPAPEESHAFARTRDGWVLGLLDQHPATAEMLAALGWFPTRGKALRRMARLVARGKVRVVGTVSLKPGRPQHVYCRWRPKVDQLAHEVLLTSVCLRLHAARILRGPRVTRTDLLPDAEVWIRNRLYFLELDRGTMSYAQIERRYRKYAAAPEFVLWVCSTAGRRDGMRTRAEVIRHAALFATLGEAVIDPHKPTWQDFAGQTVALPRESRAGTAPPADRR